MFEILKNPVRDYSCLRIHNLNSDEFRHLWLLVYWPVFGILFRLAELVIPLEACHEVYCSLDDYIPFVEIFCNTLCVLVLLSDWNTYLHTAL